MRCLNAHLNRMAAPLSLMVSVVLVMFAAFLQFSIHENSVRLADAVLDQDVLTVTRGADVRWIIDGEITCTQRTLDGATKDGSDLAKNVVLVCDATAVQNNSKCWICEHNHTHSSSTKKATEKDEGLMLEENNCGNIKQGVCAWNSVSLIYLCENMSFIPVPDDPQGDGYVDCSRAWVAKKQPVTPPGD